MAADFIDVNLIIESLWGHFGFPRDTYFDRALKHARILKGYYIDLLEELTDMCQEDLENCFNLYLSSYFLDDAFDSDHRPYALAIGMHLYVRFVEFVGRKYPEKRAVLDRYYALQMKYQAVEHDPGDEHGYSNEYLEDLDQYYMKQIILLFPIEMVEEGKQSVLFGVIKRYFVCILLADDIVDLEEDINDGVKTPLTIRVRSGVSKEEAIASFKTIYGEKCNALYETMFYHHIRSRAIDATVARLDSIL